MNGNGRNSNSGGNSASRSSSGDTPLTPSSSGPTEVNGVLDERIRNLGDAIAEIDSALAHRKVLNFRFLEQIEREREEAVRQLDTLQPPWRAGFYPQLEFLRLSLHKSITSRAHDHRGEQLKYWEDTVNLAKERRKFLDEYKALVAMRERLKVP